MGLRDRDYTQDDYTSNRKRRQRPTSGTSVVVALIVINFALWLANGLLFGEKNELTEWLWLQQDSVRDVTFWDFSACYRFLTYGFAHSYRDIWHIVFNMIGLLMFGYGMMLGIGPGGFGFVRGENVENQLGRWEFLAFYLLTIIVGGIVFAVTNNHVPRASCLGASGGVCGVIILYAWLFPRKTLLLYGILPLPMWAIGVLIVVMDGTGAARGWGGIAYSVHLAGAACGTLYYFLFFKQGRMLTGWFDSMPGSKNNPIPLQQWRVHTPPKDSTPKPSAPEDEFSRRLDEILQRYGEVGESGLTNEEREFLQKASQRFAEKHRKR